jgi:hypothetical protein
MEEFARKKLEKVDAQPHRPRAIQIVSRNVQLPSACGAFQIPITHAASAARCKEPNLTCDLHQSLSAVDNDQENFFGRPKHPFLLFDPSASSQIQVM